jgi:hypothetical protein
MVTLELLKLTKEYAQYKFFPEGNAENFGIVQVYLKNKVPIMVQDAKDVSSIYKGMALMRVAKLAEDGEFPNVSSCACF